MMNRIAILIFIFASFSCAQQSENYDAEICSRKFEFAVNENLRAEPIKKVIVEIGKSFIGTDYAAHTLETGEAETLITKLDGLDCYTFIEASLALARCVKLGKTDFEHFRAEIENIRYRGGKMNGYVSRLHYFSDWIWDNARRKIVRDVTKEIGGVRYQNHVDFMSRHPESYKRLKRNPEFVADISELEKIISARRYYFIPQDLIHSAEPKILSGDLIGITTDIPGLDIAHTGMAIKMEDGRIHLLHAPNVGKKVQISKIPLADYVKKNSKQTGIMVVRILDTKRGD